MTEAQKHSTSRRRHAQDGPTEKMREYLEVIYYLAARNERIIGARLAEWMNVTPPTVTNIVQRMEEQGYILRDGRGEIRFTDTGFALAEAMVKRHRVLERFLVDVMGIPWHKIHEEAVRLEHSLSPLMEERIVALVGHSATCPHGNPIPGSGVGYVGTVRLDQAPVGSRFVLRRIVEEAEEDSDLMRYLQSHGLMPGAQFEVIDQSPSYGVELRGASKALTISAQIAAVLWGERA
ncbi:MAG TPA: metal-dependent transcriptional regulator [Kouleothrix sp.]|uniref:metal-dependent transcriptional regulator n=1 Tax=Kouleothrix sp. TaxID=2779161 RepID=UPI002C4C70E8|nr:metal-dependent transcriptional regulator [Kouleothrix sp.]HRC77623.1 metal-dependent transcriptional regulator [Kouleothrix sp.]